MISCYELRLGNHVLVNNNVHKVCAITKTTVFTVDADESKEQIAAEHRLEDVQPVPVTDTILQECGFLYQEYFKFWQLVTTGSRSEMDIDNDYDLIDFMRRPIVKKLQSLHQLQNLYFLLKGQELTIVKKELV